MKKLIGFAVFFGLFLGLDALLTGNPEPAIWIAGIVVVGGVIGSPILAAIEKERYRRSVEEQRRRHEEIRTAVVNAVRIERVANALEQFRRGEQQRHPEKL